jgi:hypothetical protein
MFFFKIFGILHAYLKDFCFSVSGYKRERRRKKGNRLLKLRQKILKQTRLNKLN